MANGMAHGAVSLVQICGTICNKEGKLEKEVLLMDVSSMPKDGSLCSASPIVSSRMDGSWVVMTKQFGLQRVAASSSLTMQFQLATVCANVVCDLH